MTVDRYTTFLPATDAVFGRSGKPNPHHLYNAPGLATEQLKDPETGGMLLELRSTGGQTVFPPSHHEDTGEEIEWQDDAEPTWVDIGRLAIAVGSIGASALLVRAAPAADRHAYLVEISGALVRGMGRDGARQVLRAAARLVLGELYRESEGERLLDDTVRKIANSEAATGWPKLVEVIGRKRADAVERWLRIETGEGRREEAASSWGEPDLLIVSPRRLPAPQLPIDIFGPFWDAWISASAESKGSTPDYVALPLLGMAGSLIANVRRGSPWSGWIEPPIVWVANCGTPSTGKSPALDAVVDLIRELEIEFDNDFAERRRSFMVAKEIARARRQKWEAEVTAAVKKGLPPPEPPKEAEEPPTPTRRRLYTVDVTPWTSRPRSWPS